MASLPYPTEAANPAVLSEWRTRAFHEIIQDGRHARFVLPMFFYSYLPLLVYLMVPQLKGMLVRYALFGLNLSLQLWIIATCRSEHAVTGLAIGFLSGWNILWSSSLLIFNDGKKRFNKIKQTKTASGAVSYEWQPLPRSLGARFWWSYDLLFNSRGIGWDWKVNGTPSRPPAVEAALRKIPLAEAEKEDVPKTKTGRFRLSSRTTAVGHFLLDILLGAIVIDVCKIFINQDPYYWGIFDAAPPSFLPEAITSSPRLTSAYRSGVALIYMLQVLRVVFAFVPLACLLLSTGLNAEAWMYPDQFGSYTNIATRGLAGLWGGWWHFLFRYTFQSGARFVNTKLLGLKPKSPNGAVVELIISFTLSGLLHAAASITMIGPTRPWRDMYLFFGLQPIGIIIELVAAHFIGKSPLGRRMPKALGWLGHLVYAHAWMFLTVPSLSRDLARGGIFLAEILPVSPAAWLGFAGPGEAVYRWEGLEKSLAPVWDAQRWWASGPVL